MGKNILIIEDDPLALYGISKALKRQALEITTAPTGKTALEKLNAFTFDLCLVNLHLKDCNCVELVQKIKALSPETKILVMSASSLNQRDLLNNITHTNDSGFCHVITKPFDLSQMGEIVTQALQGDSFPVELGIFDSGGAKRKFERLPYSEQIRLYMEVIDSGEPNQWSLVAKSVDISDGGIGVLTDYPLKASQVVDFGEDLDFKTGVVIWSKILEDKTCRAGIKFT